jgi:hypothetical protein
VQVTGGETWVSFVNVEIKEQSKHWMHTDLPDKLKEFKQTSVGKLMATIFWDRKGGIRATRDHSNVTSVLQNTKKTVRAIQNKRCGILTSSVVLLHDNAHLHTATCT